jgi:hypothetical protein
VPFFLHLARQRSDYAPITRSLFFPDGTPTMTVNVPRRWMAHPAALQAIRRPRKTRMTLSEEEIAQTRVNLHEMQVEHRDLDLVIDHLTLNPPPDQLLIRRLKKRKLVLKDRISQLERMLVPDIPA